MVERANKREKAAKNKQKNLIFPKIPIISAPEKIFFFFFLLLLDHKTAELFRSPLRVMLRKFLHEIMAQ